MHKCKRGKEKKNVYQIYSGSIHPSSLDINILLYGFKI